jgi:LmbE family N-acetylglucosaminyl deacetylase
MLAVVAHPDDESFGLGAVLDAFDRAGTSISVLCLTHGEAYTVHDVAGYLADVRSRELTAAARILGVLTSRCVVFDPSGVTGHRDHAAATTAGLLAAADLNCPFLAGPCPISLPRSSIGNSAAGSWDTRPATSISNWQ